MRKAKQFVFFNIKMNKDVAEKLTKYCDTVGATKTFVAEHAIDEYVTEKMRLISQNMGQNLNTGQDVGSL